MAAAGAEEEEKTLIEIVEPSSVPLDVARYVSFVRDPACGAVATFEGTTRDTFDGRRVVELRYEAYGPMARRQLREICATARSRWAVERLAVAHRLGRVPVGEASVFVAASSVHRVDALAACGFLIDEVKASVPIWKKEVYEDGEVWKENREFLERHAGTTSPPTPEKEARGRCCGSKVWVEDDVAHLRVHPAGLEEQDKWTVASGAHVTADP
uniref:Molybdopterin synthase catalytic subunit n=1 Tax=Anthurium amnicola TaxID=1678845 RepID=A0A1D1XH76_9ARAE